MVGKKWGEDSLDAGATRGRSEGLLRMLLPADSDAAIITRPTDLHERKFDEAGQWTMEIRGILPVKSGSIRSAVLGGALAVP